MIFNFQFFFQFLLFVAFIICFGNGIMIIISRECFKPFAWRKRITGRPALVIGLTLIIFGLICLADLIIILIWGNPYELQTMLHEFWQEHLRK